MKKAQGTKKRQIEWVKEGIKNFRLSLSLSISLNYLRLFLVNGILFFCILGFLYLREEVKPFLAVAEQMAVLLELGEENFYKFTEEEAPDCMTVQWEQDSQTITLYDSGEKALTEAAYFMDYLHFGRSQGSWELFFQKEQTVVREEEETTLLFYYDLSESLEKMAGFLKNAAVVYLILMFFIVIESRADNKKVFKPVEELTETARTLTVANLHSERLSVQGTQKELRELTQVFNEMLDRLENSYESQKQFVSNASHELRTPIAVIQGYVHMLERWGTEDAEILKEAIESIDEEAKAMQELVEKLLFLSRHDRKTLKVQKEWFSMGEVIEDMVKETRMMVQNREIKAGLIQNVEVYGDDQLLKQAVRVFIDNAVKYSKEGDKITIRCENRGGNCILTIEDTGIGMKKEDVNHMFDRFYRSDDIRGKIEGHGLGLSIARLIILAHAGSIKVRTQYTVGTSFIITIPRQRRVPRKKADRELFEHEKDGNQAYGK